MNRLSDYETAGSYLRAEHGIETYAEYLEAVEEMIGKIAKLREQYDELAEAWGQFQEEQSAKAS